MAREETLQLYLPGKKQQATHEDFCRLLANVTRFVTRQEIDRMVVRAVEDVRAVAQSAGGPSDCAFAWSGGKDSIALQHVCELAGVRRCGLVVCNLEYPAFTRWVETHRPVGLRTVNTGQDLDWLVAHPQMLFPRPGLGLSAKWFRQVQHHGQEVYCRLENARMLFVGRRSIEGNFIRAGGAHRVKGVGRYAPLRDWGHEHVLALIQHHRKALPPYYGWPRGFIVGSGPWAKRREPDVETGWKEIFGIDPSIVWDAASKIDSAKRFIAEHGYGRALEARS